MSNTKTEGRESWSELLTAPESGQTALVSLLFFLSCLILPFSHYERLAAIFMVVAAIFYYLLTRSIRTIFLYALPALFLYGFSAFVPMTVTNMTLPCAYVAIVLGGGCGSFLLTHFHNPHRHWPMLLMPLAAYAIAAPLSGDPIRALTVLLPAAAAAVAGICLIRLAPHTEAVVLIAAVLAALLSLLGILTLAAQGTLRPTFLTDVSDKIHGGVMNYFAETQQLFAEHGLPFPYSDVYIFNLASTLVNILPALFLCACSITAFLTWRSLLGLLVAFRSVPRMPLRTLAFSMSRTSAVLFLASLVVFLFAGGSGSTPTGMVCLNMAITLSPGLALIGFSTLFAKNAPASCLNRALGIGLVILALYNPATALIFAASYGAVGVLAARFLQKHNDNSKGE